MKREAEARRSVPTMRPSELLVFDLDGTLVDSSADLSAAVNHSLRALTLAELPISDITGFIGDGLNLLLIRALRAATGASDPAPTLVADAAREFRGFYGQHLLDQTRSMPGADEILRACGEKKKAVVTNKPYAFTITILNGLGLAHHFNFVAGGDTFPERKPDPMPLLRTAGALGADPARSAMIGDGPQDIAAGRAAGFFTVGLSSGLRGRRELVEAGADLVVEDLFELARIL